MSTIPQSGRLNSQAFASLQELIRSCGDANKHDVVTVLILALIDTGVDTKRGIISVISHLGFNNRHVAIVLKNGERSGAERQLWQCDAAGHYKTCDAHESVR